MVIFISAREIEVKLKYFIFYLCSKFTKVDSGPYWNSAENSSSIKEHMINNNKWNSLTEVIDGFSV